LHKPESIAPRFGLELPIRFVSPEGLVNGHCIDVSETGIRVAFERPVDIWLEGELSFLIDYRRYSIHARVVRAGDGETGMWFRIHNDDDKLAIEKLLELAHSQE